MCYYHRFEPRNCYFYSSVTRECSWEGYEVTEQCLMEGWLTPKKEFIKWQYVGSQTLITVTTADCALAAESFYPNLWAWAKLSNFLIYNEVPSFSVTRIRNARQKNGLVLQISTKFWESHMKYPSLIMSWLLQVPEWSLWPGGRALFWIKLC